MDSKQLWDTCLGELELTLTKANFTTWFKNTFILEYKDSAVIVGVPNAFTKTWMENKYHQKILKCLQESTNQQVSQLVFKVAPITQRETFVVNQVVKTEEVQKPPQKTTPVVSRTNFEKPATVASSIMNGASELNTRYTFENFVVGKKSELAYAACHAVSENPATIYNPLFIYGGVGLGKTHLMQAVGNALLQRDASKKILYTPCETFTNEYIKSVTEGRAEQFKNKYRSVDVLLVDDIQFLAGKEGTQEAFFHTFNFLHQNDKQVVITSDRPPKAIPTLEDRLVSRFEWGMLVDVGAPDLETRIAILQSKCKEKKFDVADEIITYIATTVQNNIRELEGALNRVVAASQLTNTTPTRESVKGLLSGMVQSTKKSALTSKQVLLAVSEYFDTPLDDLTGSSRKKELVNPRQIAMYLMREEMNASYPSIGTELGGRDHTTAMHACNKIRLELENNEKLQQDIVLIKQKLYN